MHAAGQVHDLALPAEDALGQALVALGLMPRERERVVDPAGRPVDLATPAGGLREGGLYSVVAPARGRPGHEPGPTGVGPVVLPWVLAGLALTILGLSLAAGARSAVATLLGICSLLALIGWSQREEGAGYVWVPLLVGGGSVFLVLTSPGAQVLAAAAAFAVAATGGAFLALVAAPPSTRAIGAPIAVISGTLAAALLAGSLLGWELPQAALILGAGACVTLRALPHLLIGVDDGHHIDYGRFMVVRWTVRGRVPEFKPAVDAAAVRQRVRVSEARLHAATSYLAGLAAVGMWAAAAHLGGVSRLERLTAGITIAALALGLVLLSRRSAARALKFPPRLAAALGLAGAALITPHTGAALGAGALLLGAGALLLAAVVAAALAPALAGGARSIAWSRVGDLVEALAIAFVLPAAVVAAGTMDYLRGVLAG